MEQKIAKKPVQVLLENSSTSFLISTDNESRNLPYHYHEVMEILYIVKGNGTIFVGDFVNHVRKGELYIIGKNLPHNIVSKSSEPSIDPDLQIIVLQFKKEFLGEGLLRNNNFIHIDELLKKSSRGIRFQDTYEEYLSLLLKMRSTVGIQSFTTFIRLLDLLGKQNQFDLLNSIPFGFDQFSSTDDDKIKRIFFYTEQHYKEPISLSHVSSYVNFTESSFCRYFKMQTGKNYFQYLNEIRVQHACKILLEHVAVNIEEVCFACGFNDPSTFYKQFKKIIKLTPKEYHLKARKMMVVPMVA